MTEPLYADHTEHLDQIRARVLHAADPAAAVARNLRLENGTLHAGDRRIRLDPDGRVLLVAVGKAAPAMSEAAARALGHRLSQGVAAVPKGVRRAPPASIAYFQAGHPLPDNGSLAAGRAAADLLAGTRPEDLVLALVSGGASAMLELPETGIRLEDLQELNQLLLLSGARIEEFNLVRKSLSRIKAGGLARLAAPARVLALILSDVVGDRLGTIGSGPTTLRRASKHEARALLERLGLWTKTPRAVRAALSVQERPPLQARRPINLLIGTNRQILDAAAGAAGQLGFRVKIITTQMQGEARRVGLRFARRLRRAEDRPVCLLMGGETTVVVRGEGRGGRNQELALSAAIELSGETGLALMSLATDGVDGPTDAAGAIVCGETVPRALKMGVDPVAALEANDSYPALEAVGALLKTGPTGTNLNDLVVGLAYGAVRT